MDALQTKAMLMHDRNNKLLAIKIALVIKDEATVNQLVKEYMAITRQLRQLERAQQQRQTDG